MVNKKFTVIGGGTGTYSILSGLKKYTKNISAIVNMSDSGGSAKKERDEWGLLPSSDIRKSLLALADVSTSDSLLLRKLLEYRYSEGVGVRGMTFGNLFLVALTKLLGSQETAVEKAGEILNIRGKVLPVTLEKVDLIARYEDGSTVVGEHFIDEPKHNGKLKIVSLTTEPVVSATNKVISALLESDVIIIGPGGFYTTILATLVISGVKEAILKSKASKVFILNLMTEYGQTYGFTASTFLTELDKYLPVSSLDYCLINNAPIPEMILEKYRKVRARPILDDLKRSGMPYKVIAADLLSTKIVKQDKADTLKRSFVRHSPEKVIGECMKMLGLV